jgi:hypothetical protein
MLERLRAKPPEAFVFINHAPLVSYPDAWEDFQHTCEESAKWVAVTYRHAKAFGDVHVWLRNDLAPADAGEPTPR